MPNKEKVLQVARHTLALTLVGFFVISFFVGSTINPEFVDVARNPYGLFAYFIICAAAVFVPSFTTIPVVVTATFIWGPWIAGSVALIGWTIAGMLEYGAGYFAKQSIIDFLKGGNNLEEKIERAKQKVNFWHLIGARVVVPSFIFGMVRVNFIKYLLVTMLVFIPWAVGGAVGGELIRPYYERVRPWIIGTALIILLFVIDYFFIKKESSVPIDKRSIS